MIDQVESVSLEELGLHIERIELAYKKDRPCEACSDGCLCIECYSVPFGGKSTDAAWTVYIDCDNCDASASGEGDTVADAALEALEAWDRVCKEVAARAES